MITSEFSVPVLDSKVSEGDLPIRLRVYLKRILRGAFDRHRLLFDVWQIDR